MTITEKVRVIRSIMSNSLQPHGLPARLLCPWNFPGKNTGVVSVPFSRESSWPRDQIGVSCTAGRFFIIWTVKKALCLTIYSTWSHYIATEMRVKLIFISQFKREMFLLFILKIRKCYPTKWQQSPCGHEKNLKSVEQSWEIQHGYQAAFKTHLS